MVVAVVATMAAARRPITVEAAEAAITVEAVVADRTAEAAEATPAVIANLHRDSMENAARKGGVLFSYISINAFTAQISFVSS